jgi:3-hydroxyisobutyrate dehydrogenase-like beta-hydroxyacid dehydrogenase
MKVGVIGLRTMGGAMALNLRKAGFELVVHDVRPDAAKPQLAAGVEIKVPAAEIQAVLQKDG